MESANIKFTSRCLWTCQYLPSVPWHWLLELLKGLLSSSSEQCRCYSTRGRCCQTFASFLHLIKKKNSEETSPQTHFQCVKRALLAPLLLYYTINNYHPLQKEFDLLEGISSHTHWTLHPAPHYGGGDCEQCHCAECKRPVFLVKQKALQWQRELRCGATIQHELQTAWVPTYTAAPPALLLWQITRRGRPTPEIQQVLKEELGTWNPGFHSCFFVRGLFDSRRKPGRECVLLFCEELGRWSIALIV